jgi:hypothetical protein
MTGPPTDREIPFSTYDRGSEEIRSRLIALGARAFFAPSRTSATS